jgi:hypothetical protein
VEQVEVTAVGKRVRETTIKRVRQETFEIVLFSAHVGGCTTNNRTNKQNAEKNHKTMREENHKIMSERRKSQKNAPCNTSASPTRSSNVHIVASSEM